jgi:hypothetical protein
VLKNYAGQKLSVFVWTAATNLPKTGDAANLTASVSIDSGADTALANASATEDDATKSPGYYAFSLTAAETNGNKLKFSVKSLTSGVVGLAVPPVVTPQWVDNSGNTFVYTVQNVQGSIGGSIQGQLVGGLGAASQADVLTALTAGTNTIAVNTSHQVSASSVGSGTGNTNVTHNTGGPDALRYTYGSGASMVGIDGATIRAYTLADYTAGNTTLPFVAGQATTGIVGGVSGRWLTAIRLDANGGSNRYVLEFSGAGYQTATNALSL